MKKVFVDNFSEIEKLLKFEKNTFYKFMVIVRNKDGRTPLITKDAPSGETTIKQWYVDSKEYYENRAKAEMKALAEATRGRLYMRIERKNSYKMIMLLFDKISEIIKEALSNTSATPKRLNKIVNSITSDSKCTDKGCKTLMYDIDNEDEYEWYRDAITMYIVKVANLSSDEVTILPSKSGWHVICPRCFAISPDWQQEVADTALAYAKMTFPKLTIEEATDILHVVEDIKVQPNQLCLVYYSEEVDE